MSMRVLQHLFQVFSDLKIRNKLILAYYPITVLFIAAVGFLTFRFAVSTIEEQSMEIVMQAQEQAVSGISRSAESYERFLGNITLDPNVSDIIGGRFNNPFQAFDPFEERSKVKDLQDYMRNTQMIGGVLANLTVIRYSNEHNEIIPNNFHDVFDTGTDSDILEASVLDKTRIISSLDNVHIINEARVENKDWYRQLKGRAASAVWMQIAEDGKYNNISVAKEVPYLYNEQENLGMLILTVQKESLFNPDELSKGGNRYFHIVLDSRDEILYIDKSRESFYQANAASIADYLCTDDTKPVFLEKDVAMIKSSTTPNGWKVVTFIPMNMLTRDAEKIKSLVFIACIVVLILLFMVSYWLSKFFARRIERICMYMHDFPEGDFKKKLKNIHKDELGYLAQSYNEMAAKTQVLIREVYQANIDKKEAQLKALQAQINPHFLYNSLSSIIRLANIKETERIEKMAASLVKFYRMSLNKGRDIISVADEIEQIKAYVDIMKIRLGEAVDVVYEIDEAAFGYHTVKLILQPFVENALEHGIYDRETAITVKITLTMENDTIVFKVIDDGIGMKPEKCANILAAEENEAKGYGVKNVNDRIQLQFGSTYGVHIFSRLGIGTVVTIRIPLYSPE